MENLEAVKRRFLRQNRELAKYDSPPTHTFIKTPRLTLCDRINSQQSIRIRNLETEGSRLLAENLSLREQVLQLQNTLENQSQRPSFENIDLVKRQLEAKIRELGGLVADLGQIQKPNTAPRCKSQTAATRRSPGERQWRSGLGLQAVEEAMMPTIVEDKFYPRRTMKYVHPQVSRQALPTSPTELTVDSADELRGIMDDPDSQSPDIGPPPIARFDSEEPIVFNGNPTAEQDDQDQQMDAPEEALPITLETRRRRRESGPRLNIRRVSVFQSPPNTVEEGSDTWGKGVKAGAKRKLSVREDEEKTNAQSETEPFRFSRRNTPSDVNVNEDDRPHSPVRSVLASKPVNTDPVLSPKKQRSSIQDKLDKPDKKPSTAPKTSRGRLTITRTKTPTELPTLHIPYEPVEAAEIRLDSLPPKTPAADMIFSPPSTQPSTSRPESKDTPPPGDLTSNDQYGQAGRARRARSAVSYKEPSLNTKMRRPGKELVDAVIPQHERRASMDPTQLAPGEVTIKRETVEPELSWRAVPNVSIRGVTEDRDAGSPLKEKLGRRESSQSGEHWISPEQSKLDSSAASQAISVLLAGGAGSSRRKTVSTSSALQRIESRKVTETVEETEPATSAHAAWTSEERAELEVYDFDGSSPPRPATRPRVDLAKLSRERRRHSSIPASESAEDKKSDSKSFAPGHARSGSANGIRSSSTSSLAKSTAAAKSSMKEKKSSAVPSSMSSMDLKAAVAAKTESIRAERAASRRKSMML
ncbi:hypothetical protein P154DRAFT_584926 [Amniculicola lignicola CBS 123094]|uniref:Shugoshin n=1 Tax=Amniculicola lignicola CBS 123094 TaxID=1392246 RepID=A0A6A5WTC2_9PLEO|nr:hypothetical protein P154DRAFT_584926 [Amniculicola lignicola CBS 123094]